MIDSYTDYVMKRFGRGVFIDDEFEWVGERKERESRRHYLLYVIDGRVSLESCFCYNARRHYVGIESL